MNNSCVVVFPLYRAPNQQELAFLEQGIKQTEGFKQVIVAPEDLTVNQSFGLLAQLEVKRFANHYFDGIAGYNHLLLSKEFYSSFGFYNYLLIHQADVYLFKNNLQTWCDKEYDYIGAPFYRPDKLNRSTIYNWLEKAKLCFKKNKIYGSRYNKVGNGGLSLRKISTALKVLEKANPSLVNKYIVAQGGEFNEDVFWSLEAPLIIDFKIPTMDEAMQFAIEFHPKVAYKFLGETLPFGCHAPLKHNPEFWKEHIPIMK